MRKKLYLPFAVGICLSALFLQAKEPPAKAGQSGKRKAMKALAEACSPARAETDLDINNVRAKILGGGDMWWDLNKAAYEIPKGDGVHAMFAGSLWLGGIDDGDQLKLAAMTYRAGGSDFWPGPLTTDGTASVDKDVCDKYDRHWKITRQEVAIHKAWIDCKNDPDCDPAEDFAGYENRIPRVIKEWPAHGIDGELLNDRPYLAPFEDVNGDGIYDYLEDYPAYDLNGTKNCETDDLLFGDQTLWWVYNDRGNIHGETQAGALGFEIHAQAFAFSSNDEINNMTFNNYKIINRSTFRLKETYFGTWFDPDLGNYDDDLIGCDIARGLGYCYNADPYDDLPLGYGNYPPAVGFDFFQGPFADFNDGIDNDRDGCIDGRRDENGNCIPEQASRLDSRERIIMSGFMYYNRTGSGGAINETSDPENSADYYQFLQNRWKNNSPLVVRGDNGTGFSSNGTGITTRFAFPGNSYDSTGYNKEVAAPIDWSEGEGNSADKRGLHIAGPFSLAPGAVNYITTGVVWARDNQNDALFASVEKLLIADDKAQRIFDNCFDVLDGPTAPDMTIQELDQQLVLILSNEGPNNNNDSLNYVERDPLILPPSEHADSILAAKPNYFNYVFEGYQIFQLADANVPVTDLYEPSRARLVAQCDLKNDITQLINRENDPDMNALVPKDMTQEANNQGIVHSFLIDKDAFATGDDRLVNHKNYYFTVVAYAQNQFAPFDPAQPDATQKKPYLQSRLNIRTYTGIPHKPSPESGGTGQRAQYGDGPEITLIEGQGNGNNLLQYTEATETQILEEYRVDHPVYAGGAGPVDLKVVDPLGVPPGTYTITFDRSDSFSHWQINDAVSGALVTTSLHSIEIGNEQLIPELGLSLNIEQVHAPGGDENDERNNGFMYADITFENPQQQWLTGLRDDDRFAPTNWIRSGNSYTSNTAETPAYWYNDYGLETDTGFFAHDPYSSYEDILDGTWAPYMLCSKEVYDSNRIPINQGLGAAWAGSLQNRIRHRMADLRNVDIVFTNDPEKWTRVPVLEMGELSTLTEGGVFKFSLRVGQSLNRATDPATGAFTGDLIPDPNSTGWSWFPGYAIDLESGKRLNMIFGEDSWLEGHNGRDMKWNPTSSITDGFSYIFGGKHCLYIQKPFVEIQPHPLFPSNIIDNSYQGADETAHPLYNYISNLSGSNQGILQSSCMWVNIPLLAPNYSFTEPKDIPTDARVRIRVQRPYANRVIDGSNSGNPKYQFSLDGLATRTNDRAEAKDAMDLIRVVPNPYYAYSAYEAGQLDNRVKITNLPQRCVVSIFTVNGTLIRQFKKDNLDTYLEWNLKNRYNIPISSGVYIIHVDGGVAGEKILKWFGAMRPVDLDNF